MTNRSRVLCLVAGLGLVGCAGANPFTAANFAGNFVGTGAGGGTTPPILTSVDSSCDLPANRTTYRLTLQNESTTRIAFSFTMFVSSGVGGFVCQADLDAYLNAGYTPRPVDPATMSATVGCDTIRLQGGTQLLGLTLTGTLNGDPTGGTDAASIVTASPPLNGTVGIPIPELIVLGDSDTSTARFICVGSDACTQGGFAYTSDFDPNILVSRIFASRTQGTLCNTGAGAAPEWSLLNAGQDDANASAFQYTAGSNIIIRVLNRSANNDPNVNQVVWQVTGVDGMVIHDFLP
ncbi:MAG: hypothetical protein V3T70_04295 [Phycisphaerae bacterium]